MRVRVQVGSLFTLIELCVTLDEIVVFAVVGSPTGAILAVLEGPCRTMTHLVVHQSIYVGPITKVRHVSAGVP